MNEKEQIQDFSSKLEEMIDDFAKKEATTITNRTKDFQDYIDQVRKENMPLYKYIISEPTFLKSVSSDTNIPRSIIASNLDTLRKDINIGIQILKKKEKKFSRTD